MTQQELENISPEQVLNDLMKGNKKYISGKITSYNLPDRIASAANSQFPKAVILSCIDSRIPVESVFNQGIGDVFVARIAGNVVNKALLGSIEYGMGVIGSKLLMVMGHENCGAVKSAIEKLDVGSENVNSLLQKFEPAIKATKGERDTKNKEYFDNVVKKNVKLTIDKIRRKSNIIRRLEQEGKIKIAGAFYRLSDGKVILLTDED